MNLRVITQYGRGAASARTRVFQWLERTTMKADLLEYTGQSTHSIAGLLRKPLDTVSAELALRRASRSKADVVLMHRGASPFHQRDLEAQVLRMGTRSILDFDDALQWDWRQRLPVFLQGPPAFIHSSEVADVLIAGNDLLAHWASSLAREVVVIPTCVEPAAYQAKVDYCLVGRPRIGWLGAPSTEHYLSLVEIPLLELHRRMGAILVVISAGTRSLGALDQMVKRVAWTPGIEERLGSLMDVGIMPLDQTLWSRGKCSYKLLQYGAAGLPAVASPSGTNVEVASRLGYMMANDEEQWIGEITRLLTSSEADLADAGARARSVTAKSYSYEAWQSIWLATVFGESMPTVAV